ncbi:MAG TPA: hypothetical protein VGO93_01030 [Candidatus Xenobia bacterium]
MKRLNVLSFGLGAAVMVGLCASPTWAIPILATSSAGFCPADTVVCFSTVPTSSGAVTQCLGSGVSVTTHGLGVINYSGGWNVSPNAAWSGRPLIGENACGATSTPPIVFKFATPVSQVGGCMTYDPSFGGCTHLIALNSSCVVLTDIDLNTSACGKICTAGCPTNSGAFRGFTDSTAEISSFEIVGGVPAIGPSLTFGPAVAAAPEPPLPLILGSLFGVAALRKFLGT